MMRRPGLTLERVLEVAMSYQALLVHVADDEYCARRVQVAAALARRFDAELTGAYLVSTVGLTPFTSAMLPELIVEQRMAETGQAQTDAEAVFRTECDRAGLVDVEWLAPAGAPLDMAEHHARYADLVVLGQPIPHDGGFSGALANAVLLHGGRPVLVVPRDYAADFVARHVVIAWKESREAARAVADALPLLAHAVQVSVLALDPPGREDPPEGDPAQNIVTWLARHRIASTLVRAHADESRIAYAVRAHAAELGGDVVVMGGYSRPRLQEMVLGGVTRDMLADMTLPVLMSH
jgi:nucleotide-binding universal stress UspA family protein